MGNLSGHIAHGAARAETKQAGTALTMLGIMIAIAAVICTVAVGQEATRQVQDQLTALGINMIWIEAGGRNVNGVRTGNGATKTLTVDDAEAIKASVSQIVSVAPNVDGLMQVVYGNQNWYTRFRGVSSDYFEIRNGGRREGRCLPQWIQSTKPTCAFWGRRWRIWSLIPAIRLGKRSACRICPSR